MHIFDISISIYYTGIYMLVIMKLNSRSFSAFQYPIVAWCQIFKLTSLELATQVKSISFYYVFVENESEVIKFL